MTGEKKMFTS
jgi:hypothetical protein